MARFDFDTHLSYAGCCKLPAVYNPSLPNATFDYSQGGFYVDWAAQTVWCVGHSWDNYVGKATLPASLSPLGTPQASMSACTAPALYNTPSSIASTWGGTPSYVRHGIGEYNSTHMIMSWRKYYGSDGGANQFHFMPKSGSASEWYGWQKLSGLTGQKAAGPVCKLPQWFAELIGHTHISGFHGGSTIGEGNQGTSVYAFTPDHTLPHGTAIPRSTLSAFPYGTVVQIPNGGGWAGQLCDFKGNYGPLVHGYTSHRNYVGDTGGGSVVIRSKSANASRCLASLCTVAQSDINYKIEQYNGGGTGSQYVDYRVLLFSISDVLDVASGRINQSQLLPYSWHSIASYLLSKRSGRGGWPQTLPTMNADSDRVYVLERVTGPPVLHVWNII